MSAPKPKREPVYYDGVAIDPDWLDEQVSHYIPGCADDAIRLMRAYDQADLKRAQEAARNNTPNSPKRSAA